MSEGKIRAAVWPYIKSFRTYIDIGANAGTTTNPFLDEFDKIISFEPIPYVYEKISDRAEKYNVALGNETGTRVLRFPNGWERPEHASFTRYDFGEKLEVPVKKLDDYNFSDVDFIKMDVEHFEMDVCLGAEQTIRKYMPTILYENKRRSNDHVGEWLKDLGYDIINVRSDDIAYVKEIK